VFQREWSAIVGLYSFTYIEDITVRNVKAVK
jgi:hypothetical protein